VYVYSGEQIIEDRNKKIKIKAGECAFIRRNHRLLMYKNSKNDLYKDFINIQPKFFVLREFYSRLNKSKLPKQEAFSDKNVFKIEPKPDIAVV
jgi:hypothetical protein